MLLVNSLLQDEKNEMLHTNTWLTYVSTVCQYVRKFVTLIFMKSLLNWVSFFVKLANKIQP